jgi:hypothetical protein
MSNSFFVCYAREDYEYVASFKLELDNQLKIKSESLRSNTNIDLKIDQSPGTINLGEKYRDKIEKIIEESSGAILFLSKNFVTSQFINEVEIPKILERKRKDNDYLVLPIFVDSAEGVNEEISLYQAPNSEKNPLRELNGELRGLIVKKFVKELVEEISSKQTRENKSSKKFLDNLQKGFGWSLIGIPLLAYFLFVGSQNNNTNINTIAPSSSVSNSDPTVVNENIFVDKSCIKSTNISSFVEGIEGVWGLQDFSNNQLYWGPQHINDETSNLVKEMHYEYVGCNELHEAEVLYVDTMTYFDRGDDGKKNFDQIIELMTIENLKCAQYFFDNFNLGNKTTFEWNVLYLYTDDLSEIGLLCLVVKQEINGEGWLTWSYPLDDFDLDRYLVDNMISENYVKDLSVGDCITRPEFFTSKKDLFDPNEDILFRKISQVPCYYAHDHEVIGINKISKNTFNTEIEFERYIDDFCFNSTIIFEDLINVEFKEGVRNTINPDDHEPLSYWFMTDVGVNNKDSYTFICLVTFTGVYDDYKANYSLAELLNDKIYQNNDQNQNNTETFLITNCPITVSADELYIYNFSWRGLIEPLQKIEIIFKDSVSEYTFFLQADSNPLFREMINYDFKIGIAFELLNTEADLGSIEAKINFGEQKELKTECKVEINSSQD